MKDSELLGARILIVDDERANVQLLHGFLRASGYTHVQSTSDPTTVVALVRSFDPDLILLDLRMPGLDGFGVLEQLRPWTESFYLPVLVLTGDISEEAKRRSLASGARDFLHKPLNLVETRLRIRNLLETRFLHLELRRQNQTLEARVRERTRELELTQLEILDRLSMAADCRDDDTGQHTRRVSHEAARLAEAIGLPPDTVDLIERAAALHDIGKIGVPDNVLLKPGRLTPEEAAVIRRHPAIGARLLGGGRSPLIRLAEQIALCHHERWDGTGYPRGLRGAQIPIAARIVALVDVVDALAYDRPYRRAWPRERVIQEIRSQSGRHFDPELVEAWVEMEGAAVAA